MTFFNDWELWQKMCFVLGCLICVVLIYGTGVQIRNRYKIKKIRREGDWQRRPRNRNSDGGHEIPFGSRALESGIEIEGIWISKPNTPVPSPHQAGTPAASRPSSPAPGQTPNSSSKISSTQPEGASQRPLSSKVMQTGNSQSVSSPTLAATTDRPPAQDDAPMSERYSRQLDSLGLEEPKTSRAKIQQSYFQPDEDTNRRRTTLPLDYPSATYVPESDRRLSGPPEATQQQHNVHTRIPVDEDYDHLQAMYSHRRSHAAEIGQLRSARNSSSKLADADARTSNPHLPEDELGKPVARDWRGQ